MNRQTWSRSERRLERRQVLLMLAVVAAIALGSFALGVMVGRAGSEERLAAANPDERARIPVARPSAAPGEAGTAPAGSGETSQADAETAREPEARNSELTFYDSLPRGEEPPLGSGINLPPEAETAAEKSSAGKQEPTPQPAAAREPEPAKTVSRPQPDQASTAASGAAGSFVLQVASFGSPDDAGVLQARLAKKGYTAYVRQADLGDRGIWYRVFVGPVKGAEQADAVVARLRAEEKLSPLVRRR